MLPVQYRIAIVIAHCLARSTDPCIIMTHGRGIRRQMTLRSRWCRSGARALVLRRKEDREVCHDQRHKGHEDGHICRSGRRALLVFSLTEPVLERENKRNPSDHPVPGEHRSHGHSARHCARHIGIVLARRRFDIGDRKIQPAHVLFSRHFCIGSD